MIVSGSISTVAGISFFLQAAAPHVSLSTWAATHYWAASSFSFQHCAWDGRPARAPVVGADRRTVRSKAGVPSRARRCHWLPSARPGEHDGGRARPQPAEAEGFEPPNPCGSLAFKLPG